MNIQVPSQHHGERLDKFLSSQLPDLSRSRIQSLLKSGDIILENKQCKPKQAVETGDTITIRAHALEADDTPDTPQPEDIPLDIIYEDDDIIVINKPHGIVVHPAAGNRSGTLVNALLHHCGNQLAEHTGERAAPHRPGIVHRLDKDTSGCIIVAKTQLALHSLIGQFAERHTEKHYLAVVHGTPNKERDTIFTHIGRHPVNRQKMTVLNPGSGKTAITDYLTLGTDPDTGTSLIHCHIHTGRTHQIRVHMVHLGTPILGDPIYAKPQRQPAQPGRLMLHARRLVITHPTSGERLAFLAPIPSAFEPWTNHHYDEHIHQTPIITE